MKTILRLSLAIVAVIFSGCVIVTHKSDDGKKKTETTYISPAFGSKGIDSANFEEGRVTGVRSEQSSMVDVIDHAYSAGLAAGAKLKP